MPSWCPPQSLAATGFWRAQFPTVSHIGRTSRTWANRFHISAHAPSRSEPSPYLAHASKVLQRGPISGAGFGGPPSGPHIESISQNKLKRGRESAQRPSVLVRGGCRGYPLGVRSLDCWGWIVRCGLVACRIKRGVADGWRGVSASFQGNCLGALLMGAGVLVLEGWVPSKAGGYVDPSLVCHRGWYISWYVVAWFVTVVTGRLWMGVPFNLEG